MRGFATGLFPRRFAIPLAYFGLSYWALVVAYMAEAFILAAIYFFVARQYLVRPSFDMQSYRDIRRQSLGFSLGGVATFVAQYIDNIIVARLIGTAELGIYFASVLSDRNACEVSSET